jgi:hypothetical protein
VLRLFSLPESWDTKVPPDPVRLSRISLVGEFLLLVMFEVGESGGRERGDCKKARWCTDGSVYFGVGQGREGFCDRHDKEVMSIL